MSQKRTKKQKTKAVQLPTITGIGKEILEGPHKFLSARILLSMDERIFKQHPNARKGVRRDIAIEMEVDADTPIQAMKVAAYEWAITVATRYYPPRQLSIFYFGRQLDISIDPDIYGNNWLIEFNVNPPCKLFEEIFAWQRGVQEDMKAPTVANAKPKSRKKR